MELKTKKKYVYYYFIKNKHGNFERYSNSFKNVNDAETWLLKFEKKVNHILKRKLHLKKTVLRVIKK